MATEASGRSMEKLATLDTTRVLISPARNASKSFCRSLTRGVALDHGSVQALADLVQLVDVLADHQELLARCSATSCSTSSVLVSEVAQSRYLSASSAMA